MAYAFPSSQKESAPCHFLEILLNYKLNIAVTFIVQTSVLKTGYWDSYEGTMGSFPQVSKLE